MAQPFLYDEEFRLKMKTLKEYAEANPFSYQDMLERRDNKGARNCELVVGYKVDFSIGHGSDDGSLVVRHLSVSTGDKTFPSVSAVIEIMKALGFTLSLEECNVYLEGENRNIINVLERII